MPGALSALYLSRQNRRIVSSNVTACVFPITVILLSLAASSINCSDIQNRLRSAVSLSHTIRPFRLASRRTHVYRQKRRAKSSVGMTTGSFAPAVIATVCPACIVPNAGISTSDNSCSKAFFSLLTPYPHYSSCFPQPSNYSMFKTSFSPSRYLSYFKRSGTRTGPY